MHREELSTLVARATGPGYGAIHVVVARLLRELGSSLQANRKVREGDAHTDRSLQFEHINRRVKAHLRRSDPVISVDKKRKELVGSVGHSERECRRKGQPPELNVHEFIDPELGKAIPYGVYDIARNKAGSVSELTTTPRSLQSLRSSVGGAGLARVEALGRAVF